MPTIPLPTSCAAGRLPLLVAATVTMSSAVAADFAVPVAVGYAEVSLQTRLDSNPGSLSTDSAEREVERAQFATIAVAPQLRFGPVRVGGACAYGRVVAGGQAVDQARSFVLGLTTDYAATSASASGQNLAVGLDLAWLPELGEGFALGPMVTGRVLSESLTSSEATQTKPTALIVPGDLVIQDSDWYRLDLGLACEWQVARTWRLNAALLGGLRRVRGDLDFINRSDLAHPGIVYRGTGVGWSGALDLTWQAGSQAFLTLGARFDRDDVAGDAQRIDEFGIITDLQLTRLERQALLGQLGFGWGF
jgi:hypothetical protein